HCGKRCKAPAGAAGKGATCPRCGAHFQVPTPETPPAPGVQTATVSCPGCRRLIHLPAEELALPSIQCAKCLVHFRPADHLAREQPPPPPPLVAAAVAVLCPCCGGHVEIDPRLAGYTVACPHCGQQLQGSPPRSGAAPQVGHVSAAPPVPEPAGTPSRQNPGDGDDELPSRRRRRTEASGGAAVPTLGIASMVLGVVGLLLSLIPCIGVYSLPLSALGVLVGIVGGVVALSRGGHGIGFPIAGLALNGTALAIAIFWLGLLNAA